MSLDSAANSFNFAAVTGFAWTWEGVDLMNADRYGGYRIMVGGVDGNEVLAPQADPGLTWALGTRRLAEAAADHVVQQELVLGETDTVLLSRVEVGSRPEDAEFTEQLEDLHWQLLALRPDSERLAGLRSLWSAVEAGGGPEEAWTAVIMALLADPEFVSA